MSFSLMSYVEAARRAGDARMVKVVTDAGEPHIIVSLVWSFGNMSESYWWAGNSVRRWSAWRPDQSHYGSQPYPPPAAPHRTHVYQQHTHHDISEHVLTSHYVIYDEYRQTELISNRWFWLNRSMSAGILVMYILIVGYTKWHIISFYDSSI